MDGYWRSSFGGWSYKIWLTVRSKVARMTPTNPTVINPYPLVITSFEIKPGRNPRHTEKTPLFLHLWQQGGGSLWIWVDNVTDTIPTNCGMAMNMGKVKSSTTNKIHQRCVDVYLRHRWGTWELRHKYHKLISLYLLDQYPLQKSLVFRHLTQILVFAKVPTG